MFSHPRAWVFAMPTRTSRGKEKKNQLGSEMVELLPQLDSASHVGHLGFWNFTSAVSLKFVYLHARNYCKYLLLLMYFILTIGTTEKVGTEIHLFSHDHTPKWLCPMCYSTRNQRAKLWFEPIFCSSSYLLSFAASPVLLMPLFHL